MESFPGINDEEEFTKFIIGDQFGSRHEKLMPKSTGNLSPNMLEVSTELEELAT